jgi:hypothetical protein
MSSVLKECNHEARSLAASLEPLAQPSAGDLTIGGMMRRIESEDGPGPVLFILTLPVLLPLPPGVSMILALPLLLVAPQIILGRRCLWLPRALSKRSIKHDDLVKLLHRVIPWLEKGERYVRPRLRFLTGRLGARVVGCACTLIALLLVLPIPFANLAPAIAMSVFALGLARRDGLLILGGYALLALAGLIIWLGVHGFTFGIGQLRGLF